MAQGKILIVNKIDGSLLGWFGENNDDSRPTLDNIALVELDIGAYEQNFIGCPMSDIKVTDITNKVVTFTPPSTNTSTS